MAILSIDTMHPLADHVDARTFIDTVIRRRQGEQIDESVRAGIVGTPLNLKRGAPENKLAHLTAEANAPMQESLPFTAPTEAEVDAKLATPTPASLMSPAVLAAAQAAAAVAKAAEPTPEKPKRTRAPKPEVVKTVTVDEVRAVMVEMSAKGPEEQTRQRGILTSMGFEKLSAVPPEKLVELLAKIKGQ